MGSFLSNFKHKSEELDKVLVHVPPLSVYTNFKKIVLLSITNYHLIRLEHFKSISKDQATFQGRKGRIKKWKWQRTLYRSILHGTVYTRKYLSINFPHSWFQISSCFIVELANQMYLPHLWFICLPIPKAVLNCKRNGWITLKDRVGRQSSSAEND